MEIRDNILKIYEKQKYQNINFAKLQTYWISKRSEVFQIGPNIDINSRLYMKMAGNTMDQLNQPLNSWKKFYLKKNKTFLKIKKISN